MYQTKSFMKTYRAEKRQKAIKDYSRLLFTALKYIAIIGALYMLIDLFTFFMWVFSEQTPHDTIYIGSVTKNIISLIIK